MHPGAEAEQTMGMPLTHDHLYTVDEVRALAEADPRNKYEVIDGELFVSPSPRRAHERAVREFIVALHAYLALHPEVGEVFAGGDVETGPRTCLEPDVLVVPFEPPGATAREWDVGLRARLVIEVLSPSTASVDRLRKRPVYLGVGAEYWIVDAEARAVERWAPGAAAGEVRVDTITWRPDGVSDAFVVELPDVFARVNGERR